MATYILAKKPLYGAGGSTNANPDRRRKAYVPGYAYVDQYLPKYGGGGIGLGGSGFGGTTNSGWTNATGKTSGSYQGIKEASSQAADEYRKIRFMADMDRINATAAAMRAQGIDPTKFVAGEIEKVYNQPDANFKFAAKGEPMRAGKTQLAEGAWMDSGEAERIAKTVLRGNEAKAEAEIEFGKELAEERLKKAQEANKNAPAKEQRAEARLGLAKESLEMRRARVLREQEKEKTIADNVVKFSEMTANLEPKLRYYARLRSDDVRKGYKTPTEAIEDAQTEMDIAVQAIEDRRAEKKEGRDFAQIRYDNLDAKSIKEAARKLLAANLYYGEPETLKKYGISDDSAKKRIEFNEKQLIQADAELNELTGERLFPVLTTQEELDKLASGTLFVDGSDGLLKRKD